VGQIDDPLHKLVQLEELMAAEDITDVQTARIHTLLNLLTPLVVEETITVHGDHFHEMDDRPVFTGSDAVAMVINQFGQAEDGFKYVYDVVPSTVGSEGTGYYVFLVPQDHDAREFEIIRMYFATSNHEILSFH